MGAGGRVIELIHGAGEELLGGDVIEVGEFVFAELAAAFGDLEVGLGEGELGAHGDLRVVVGFRERLDDAVRALADGYHAGGGFDAVRIGVAGGDGIAVGHRETAGADIVRGGFGAFGRWLGGSGVGELIGALENAGVGAAFVEFEGVFGAGFRLDEDFHGVCAIGEIGAGIDDAEVEVFPDVSGGHGIAVVGGHEVERRMGDNLRGGGRPFFRAIGGGVSEADVDVFAGADDEAIGVEVDAL